MKMKSLTLFFFGILKIAVALVPDPKAPYLQNIIKIEGKFKKDKNLMWRKKGRERLCAIPLKFQRRIFSVNQSAIKSQERIEKKKKGSWCLLLILIFAEWSYFCRNSDEQRRQRKQHSSFTLMLRADSEVWKQTCDIEFLFKAERGRPKADWAKSLLIYFGQAS